MLLKLGVDISRLNRPCRRALSKVDYVFSLIGEEAVITSTYEGSHSPSSLHYANDAFDVRLPKSDTNKIVQSLHGTLGPDFDVILESSHIHIEYDPK